MSSVLTASVNWWKTVDTYICVCDLFLRLLVNYIVRIMPVRPNATVDAQVCKVDVVKVWSQRLEPDSRATLPTPKTTIIQGRVKGQGQGPVQSRWDCTSTQRNLQMELVVSWFTSSRPFFVFTWLDTYPHFAVSGCVCIGIWTFRWQFADNQFAHKTVICLVYIVYFSFSTVAAYIWRMKLYTFRWQLARRMHLSTLLRSCHLVSELVCQRNVREALQLLLCDDNTR